ncbi:MAG: hypothetical protein V1800_15780 [Candidatus Latescibacterota bacterium]
MLHGGGVEIPVGMDAFGFEDGLFDPAGDLVEMALVGMASADTVERRTALGWLFGGASSIIWMTSGGRRISDRSFVRKSVSCPRLGS